MAHYERRHSSKSSTGGGSSSFWFPRSGSSTSFYKRSPRPNFIRRLIQKIKKLLLELLHYARKHPVKVLLPLVMTLVSGGVLHNVARSFGVSLPTFLQGEGAAKGARGVRAGYDAWYGSQSRAGSTYGLGGGLADGGASNILGNVVKVASAFL